MEMSNTCTIPATIEATWEALNDPQFLKDCITGCESIELVEENDYKVVMAAKVGPVSARFNGRMRLEDLNPPKSYSIKFEGQGGVAGFAKGSARVELVPEGATTLMTYNVSAQVGGKLAQIGSRLIDAAARKVADDFFAAFNAKIASQQSSAAGESADAVKPVATDAGTQSYKRWALAAIAAVVAAGIAWFTTRGA